METITIITAVRNAVETIGVCIESVRMQQCEVEHIVIDGCSTDGTLDVVNEHRPHLATVVSEPDNGYYEALNKGIDMSTGGIVGILNADDMYPEPTVLPKVLEAFQTPTDSCYGDLAYVKSTDINRVVRFWKAGAYRPGKLYFGWMPPHPTFFARRSIYRKYGLYNSSLGSAADYELMLRFLLKFSVSSAYVPGTLVKMRMGGMSNASIKNRIRANKMDRLAWKINEITPHPWTLWMKPLRKIGQFFLRPGS